MATYDDYDGVYFSVQAIRLYHPEVTDRTEILVLDNHPSGPCAKPLKDLERQVAGYRYVPYERIHGNWVRDLLFREANAEFVLCMDSHVLFRPGALARLVEYLEGQPGPSDLWQGPLMGDNLKPFATHFDPVWRDRDVRRVGDGPARSGPGRTRVRDPDARARGVRVPPGRVAGLQSPAAAGSAWKKAISTRRSDGRAAGHSACRSSAGRTVSIGRSGTRYPVSVEDRVRNYLLTHDELGLDPGAAIAHFEQEFGAESRAAAGGSRRAGAAGAVSLLRRDLLHQPG